MNPPSSRRAPSPGQARPGTVLGVPILAVVIGAVAVLAAVAVALSVGGEDGGEADDRPYFGAVHLSGEALPDMSAARPDDPAVGRAAPVVDGFDLDGADMRVAPSGEPVVLAFLAHWCPHCQAELPVLAEAMASGDLDGFRTVAVLTGTDESRPNFPPAAWLDREEWEGEVLLDDERYTLAAAFGLTNYPFLVWLDGDGEVVMRTAGETGPGQLRQIIDTVRQRL